ncbi:type 1 glutamine amidotransferase [Metapseudomonas resinovorans]|uniref:Putative amidotransferase n=1 Tax=Metapseudomonas resinovorans NBRC 106553 TaxID=1245471 RepID=S6AF06_METRE|nr:type 1 glutamine amidotransferase [Pseudomonas resinovorans]BAN46220.1 putative amidotransferase [Pseudomonas resinovorans NBRC 106553]
MRVAILQHVPFEGPGRVKQWLDLRAARARTHLLYADARLPEPEDFELLIVMGGPMSVHDEAELPWLKAEKALIRQALDAGKRVLGICLGGQLLAEVLGAEVRKGEVEIGWWPMEKHAGAERSPLGRMLPQRLLAMHWHGETFDLPPGAIALYGSAACANQGFVWEERAIGLQCHLEATPESIEAMLDACAADLAMEGSVEDAAAIRDGYPHCSALAPTLFRLLDYLTGPHAALT